MRWLWTTCALAIALALAWIALRGAEREPAVPAPAAPIVSENPASEVGPALIEEARDALLARAHVEPTTTPAEPAPHADVAEVDLQIVDPLDVPIPGARVRLPEVSEEIERVTAADGRCRIPRSAGSTVLVVVEAEGCFSVRKWVELDVEPKVVLHPLARLSGLVLERGTRTPIAEAHVSVPWGVDQGGDRAVVSDARGAFDDLEVPAGVSFRVAVRAAGYLEPSGGEVSLQVGVHERETFFEIQLTTALVGEFLVLSSPDGEPVADASVSVRPTKYTTDEAGRVRVDRSLRIGDVIHRLDVQAAGHCATLFQVEHVGDENAPCVLHLPRATRIAGIVRDERGEPVQGLFVRAYLEDALQEELRRSAAPPTVIDGYRWPESASWQRRFEAAKLDDEAQGRFLIDGLPPGLPELMLAVIDEQRVLARRRVGPLGAPGSTLQLEWQLAPRGDGAVHGRLLRNGEPHAGFLTWTQGQNSGGLMVQEDGAFELDGLDAGPLELDAEFWGASMSWGDEARVSATVQVVAGQRVEFDLRGEVRLAEIRGSLTGLDGTPMAGVDIRALPVDAFGFAQGTTGPDGDWTLEVADLPQLYRIECGLPLREQGLEVPPGARDVALHVAATGTLRFRAIAAESGLAIPAVAIERFTPSRVRFHVAYPGNPAPDAAGWVSVALPEGDHELRAWSMDGSWLPESRELRVSAGATSEVEFSLQAAQSLSLRLSHESEPLPGEHVWLLLPEQDWPLVTAEWRDGRGHQDFGSAPQPPNVRRNPNLRPGSIDTLRGLAPGRYRFKVAPDDVRIEPEWIDVPAPGVVEVRWSPRE